MPNMDKILDAIWQSGLQITKMKMMILNRMEANQFYRDLQSTNSFK